MQDRINPPMLKQKYYAMPLIQKVTIASEIIWQNWMCRQNLK